MLHAPLRSSLPWHELSSKRLSHGQHANPVCSEGNVHGMQLIYLGPLGADSCQLVDYLRAQPGVVPLKPGHNPATWMLEVTGGAVATSARAAPLDFAAAYQARPSHDCCHPHVAHTVFCAL